ncbi:hypothetical protein LBYZC6_26300 [Lacrimispora brassicae]
MVSLKWKNKFIGEGSYGPSPILIADETVKIVKKEKEPLQQGIYL